MRNTIIEFICFLLIFTTLFIYYTKTGFEITIIFISSIFILQTFNKQRK